VKAKYGKRQSKGKADGGRWPWKKTGQLWGIYRGGGRGGNQKNTDGLKILPEVKRGEKGGKGGGQPDNQPSQENASREITKGKR